MHAVLVVAAALLVSSASAASFTESIDSTWADRWHHSSLEKYNGRFAAEAPPGSQDVALKVIGLLAVWPWLPDPSAASNKP